MRPKKERPGRKLPDFVGAHPFFGHAKKLSFLISAGKSIIGGGREADAFLNTSLEIWRMINEEMPFSDSLKRFRRNCF
jgi:hypothetical protein